MRHSTISCRTHALNIGLGLLIASLPLSIFITKMRHPDIEYGIKRAMHMGPISQLAFGLYASPSYYIICGCFAIGACLPRKTGGLNNWQKGLFMMAMVCCICATVVLLKAYFLYHSMGTPISIALSQWGIHEL